MMKLTFLMCACFTLTVSASTWAQQRVTMKLGQTGLKEVFNEIRRQTNRTVVYNDDQLSLGKKVKADFVDTELEEVLKSVLAGQGMTYKFMDDYIMIVKENAVPQEMNVVTIKGTVVDKTGSPLPGVTVLIKGTTLGVSTDIDGKFSLSVPEPHKAILQFSMVGMALKEVLVGVKKEFRIQLEEEASDLDEVVVIGYGSAKKKDLTGSVERFDSRILEENAAINVADMMQGQIAGLSILTGSGAPGEGARLEIRGVPSLNGATTPLIVVNEVPMAPGFDLNELNPGDIASIDVLKGASASAIYGSRGAAGVIMITLKSGGREQKPTVSYDFSYGLKSLVSEMNTLTTDEFKLLMMEAVRNEAMAQGIQDITTYSYYKTISDPNYFGEENTPWMSLLMQKGTVQQHRVAIRGGGTAFGYNASFGYNTEKGQLKSLSFDRYTYSMGFNTDLNKWMKVTMDISGTISNGRSNPYFRMSDAVSARPDIKAFNEDGTLYLHSYMSNGRLQYSKNPIIELTENGTDSDQNNLRLAGALDFTILPSLKLKTRYAFDSRKMEDFSFASSRTYTGSNYWNGQKGQATQKHYDYKKNEFEATLSYSDVLGKKGNHRLQATGVVSYWEEMTNDYQHTRVDFADDEIQNGIWQGTNEPMYNARRGDARGSCMLSYVARANYTFNERYLLTASVRADGSSKFSPDNRWGVFPAVAAGWIISEEKFMKNSKKWLPFLKLRAEWGISGNGWVGEYGWRTLFNNSEYEHLPAIYPSQVGNDELKWESTQQYDLALDYGFLKNRCISGSLGIYLKKTDGLLYSFTMAPSTGLSSTQTNFANIENKGIEFSINANIISQKDWTWSVGANINKNLNKITKINAEFVSQPGSSYLSNTVIQEGKSLGLIYGYETDGVFRSREEVEYYESLNKDHRYQGTTYAPPTTMGDLKLVDQNGDGYVNVESTAYEDRIVLGCSRPKFEGGFNTRLGWKGLTLSVQGTFSYGAKKIWGAKDKQFQFMVYGSPDNVLDLALDRWRPENPNSNSPCVRLNNYMNYFTDFSVCDASYLKVQNINLSYNLPNRVLEKAKVLSRASVFVSANNLITWTPYPGPSPESYSSNVISGASADTEAYPRTWTFNFGVNITFK